jgi:hypothetical protein
MKIVKIGHSENTENGDHNGSLNGSSGNGSANGNGYLRRGSVLRLLRADGQWENGTVEQVIRTRFRGDIRSEYQVRFSNGGGLAYFLAEDFAPATAAVPTLMERLQKIAFSCPRAARGADGNWLGQG